MSKVGLTFTTFVLHQALFLLYLRTNCLTMAIISIFCPKIKRLFGLLSHQKYLSNMVIWIIFLYISIKKNSLFGKLNNISLNWNEIKSWVFLLRQLWLVSYYAISSSNNLSNENKNTGVSVVFKKRQNVN